MNKCLKKIYKCSVVLALYNGEKYIKEQLDSIVNQTIKPSEIIIVDDNSIDDSYNYVIKYIKNYRKVNYKKTIINFRLYKNTKNIGYVKTFAKGLKLAKHNIIFLSDQDDVWFKNKIEEHLKLYNDKKINAIACQMIFTDKDLKVSRKQKEDNSIERIDMKKACFGAKMFYGCQLSIRKTKDFDRLVKALNDKNVDVHDRLICYYYAGIKGLYYYHKNLLYHRIHDDNVIGNGYKYKAKGNYDIRVMQALKDYNIISLYNNLINKKSLSYYDNKNKNYIDELIQFREERYNILKNKNTVDIVNFAIKNHSKYSRKKVLFGDIYFGIVK